jgi:hypothetical protein
MVPVKASGLGLLDQGVSPGRERDAEHFLQTNEVVIGKNVREEKLHAKILVL